MSIICKNCGAELDERSKFCPNCGSKAEKREYNTETNTGNISDLTETLSSEEPVTKLPSNKKKIITIVGILICLIVSAISFASNYTKDSSVQDTTVSAKSEFETKVEELSNKQFTWRDYDTETSYEDIMRYPDKYYLNAFAFGGDIIQVVDNGDGTSFALLAQDGDLNKMTYITYDNNLHDGRILKGDNIYVFGVFGGTIDYQTVGGNTETVPLIGVTQF